MSAGAIMDEENIVHDITGARRVAADGGYRVGVGTALVRRWYGLGRYCRLIFNRLGGLCLVKNWLCDCCKILVFCGFSVTEKCRARYS